MRDVNDLKNFQKDLISLSNDVDKEYNLLELANDLTDLDKGLKVAVDNVLEICNDNLKKLIHEDFTNLFCYFIICDMYNQPIDYEIKEDYTIYYNKEVLINDNNVNKFNVTYLENNIFSSILIDVVNNNFRDKESNDLSISIKFISDFYKILDKYYKI